MGMIQNMSNSNMAPTSASLQISMKDSDLRKIEAFFKLYNIEDEHKLDYLTIFADEELTEFISRTEETPNWEKFKCKIKIEIITRIQKIHTYVQELINKNDTFKNFQKVIMYAKRIHIPITIIVEIIQLYFEDTKGLRAQIIAGIKTYAELEMYISTKEEQYDCKRRNY